LARNNAADGVPQPTVDYIHRCRKRMLEQLALTEGNMILLAARPDDAQANNRYILRFTARLLL
jgi:hypothetical protein